MTRPIATLALSALLVASAGPAAAQDVLSFSRVGTHPSDRELSGENANSEGAQGIAFGGGHWFYATTKSVYRLDGTFRNSDRRFGVTSAALAGTRCDHTGGVDFYAGELFAAVDNCDDGTARVMVLDAELQLRRVGRLPEIGNSFPWVAVDPTDDGVFYAVANDGRELVAFPRTFADGAALAPIKRVRFADHPADRLGNFWKQGGAFGANGLFYRVVDDAKDEDSHHTGIWVYALDRPARDGSAARRVGFVNIPYDPDIWVPFACGFDECKRSDELEDVDAAVIPGGGTAGDVHVLMLSNEPGQDDVSVYHYASGDFDGDGARDAVDNCPLDANPGQEDVNGNGVGLRCDPVGVAVLVAALG